MPKNDIKVALIGNPNTGKTSLFNQLTGLNQKVGNYPGVTVDKKEGTSRLTSSQNALITDLPGTYSINPTSIDESIVLKTLLKKDIKESPDVILVVADVENLKRNLLLFSQIFKKPLQEMAQIYYDVPGTFEIPNINTTNAQNFALMSAKF